MEDFSSEQRLSKSGEDIGQNASFGNLLPQSPELLEVPECDRRTNSPNMVDSFMVGLGLDGANMSKYDHSVNGEGE